MTKVLIALDGSEHDRSIVQQTLRLFGDTSRYVLANVSPDPAMVGASSMSFAAASWFSTPALSAFADGLDRRADIAQQITEDVVEAVGLRDAVAVGEVGHPVSVLLELAESNDVDVIVVGASERSWFSRLFDPSVEAAVVDRARRPVLVVHHEHAGDV